MICFSLSCAAFPSISGTPNSLISTHPLSKQRLLDYSHPSQTSRERSRPEVDASNVQKSCRCSWGLRGCLSSRIAELAEEIVHVRIRLIASASTMAQFHTFVPYFPSSWRRTCSPIPVITDIAGAHPSLSLAIDSVDPQFYDWGAGSNSVPDASVT